MGRLAMNEMTTFRWSFEEDIQRYAATGYDAVGVWRHKLSDYGEEKGLELLAEHGLAVSSLCWAGGFTGSEGWSHEESIQDARQAIELAAAIRAHCLVVHSGARGLHTQNHVRRLLHQAIDALLPLAESMHVTLALEPMHPAAGAKWTFLNDLDDALRFSTSYGSSYLKLVLDCYDWGRAEFLHERMGQLVPQLALVQLADGKDAPCGERNRCLLGAGTVPLARLVSQLIEAGYLGPFEVELLGEDIESCDYDQLLEDSLRNLSQWIQPELKERLPSEAAHSPRRLKPEADRRL
jgi:sugar phosphate isomerase/epimerase